MLFIERDDALGNHDAVGVAEEIRAGRISVAEAQAAAIARAQEVNPQLNAIVAMVEEPDGGTAGPFAGVPTFIKDNEDLAGMPTRHGSRATSDMVQTAPTPFVRDFQALGFNAIGKSTMPEFGLTASTETLSNGATRNPRNLNYSVGGSSGGAAALVAAGVVPLAHANDGGGSIRIPASCCGLVGLKPSRGRFATRPEIDKLPIKIGHEGVVTRTVRDTATFFYEMDNIRRKLPPMKLVTGPSNRRLRIGVFTDGPLGVPVEAQTRDAVMNAAKECEALGHHVEQISFPYGDQFGIDFVRFWAGVAFAIKRAGKQTYGKDFDPSLLEPIGQELASYFGGFALKLPTTLRRLKRFPEEYAKVFAEYDVVISPVTSHHAPEIGYLSPQIDGHTHLVRLIRFATFTAIQNTSGAPAMSLPLGVTGNGVPIGVQFAGGFGDEETLLGLAFELEEAVGWK